MTNIPIKSNGNSPRKKELPQPNFGAGIFNLAATYQELQRTKEDLKNTIEQKATEIDQKIEEANETIKSVEKRTTEAVNTIENVKKEAIEYIKGIEAEKGEDGKDAEPLNEDDIIERILAQIPAPQVIDEKKLRTSILKSLPEKKGDLKIITEKIETDPMSVIDRILELAKEGTFKFKSEWIDGLDQTISAYYNQVGRRGYLHGGGDTVVAGTNVIITTNANGQKVISAMPAAGGVTSLNGMIGAVILAAGSNITLTPSGNTITISSTGGSTSPLTTKGDLYTFTTVNARLGVGSDGQILSADATQPTGLKWITASGTGSVTNVTSNDGSILVTNPTTTPDLAIVSAPKLTTARTINGVSFDGTANIVVTAAAGTLTGTTLNATVVTSSLTSVGTLVSGTASTGFVVAGVTMTLGSDATGDIYYRNSSGILTRLGIGSSGQVVTVSGGIPSWATPTTGTVTSVSGTTNRITVATGTTTPVIDISASYVGQSSITTLGTITTGVWNATKIGLAYGGTNADLSATGGTGQYLKQSSVGANITVGTISASDIASGAALTKTDDTNVTLTLGGTPSTALLVATSLTLGWTGTLAVSRGGTGGGSASITLFNNITGYTASGATGTTSTNLVFSTSPTLVTPTLGVATATSINKVSFTAPTTAATFAFGVDNTTQTFQGTDTIVGRATTDTLTNKTLISTTNTVEQITTTASSATPTPTGGSLRNFFYVTALATGATFAAPSGTPVNDNYLTIRILDNGSPQTLAWNAIYVAVGAALPTTTVANTTLYVGFKYNSASATWDCLGNSATTSGGGSGTVTSIATNNGITGGTITTTGTIGLATISNNTILANISGGTAIPIANTLTAIIDTISATQGVILYRGSSAWSALGVGTAGQVLMTNGASANPSWGFEKTYALFDHYADVNNTSTTETDLYSDTIASNTLSANGDKIIAEYEVNIANTNNSKTIKVYFAGTQLGTSGTIASLNVDTTSVKVLLIRSSSSTARVVATIFTSVVGGLGTLNATITETDLTGLDFTTTNIIKITGQGGASNETTAKLGTVTKMAAA